MRFRPAMAIAALLMAGCASPDSGPPWTHTGDPLVDGKAAIQHAPARDRVLWQYRTATTAMRRGDFELAKELLDAALQRLGGIYGSDADARKARSLFSAESRKTFVGEPYERVMAYYYRGILYWMDGEIDNARACFRSAQFMDADVENKEYASDYVVLEYLDGFATTKLGGDGRDAFKRAEVIARQSLPPYDRQANVLFFADLGTGPTKYSTGSYGEQLRIRPGSSAAQSVQVRVDGLSLRAPVRDDLSFQASTRGGRVMDHVLANKAVFKTTTGVASDAAIISGAVLAAQSGGNDTATGVGVGLLVAGLVGKIVSSAATPAADVRTWENLPQYIAFAATQVPAGTHQISIEFLDAGGVPLAEQTRTVSINISSGSRDTVVYVSDKDR